MTVKINKELKKELLDIAFHVKDYGFAHIKEGGLVEKMVKAKRLKKKSPEEKFEDASWRKMRPVFSIELRQEKDTNELDWRFDWKENRGAIVVTIKKRMIELQLMRRNMQRDLSNSLNRCPDITKLTSKEQDLRSTIRQHIDSLDRDIYVLNALWKVVYGRDWHESEDREERQEIANYRLELLGDTKVGKH